MRVLILVLTVVVLIAALMSSCATSYRPCKKGIVYRFKAGHIHAYERECKN